MSKYQDTKTELISRLKNARFTGAVPNPDPGPYRGCPEASRLLLVAFWEAFGEPPDASGSFWGLKTFAGAYRSFPGTFREVLGGFMATDSLWEASGKVFFKVESF